MKLLKLILTLALISTLFLPAAAGKRVDRKSMKELTDPNSPSYVPFPYPKTKEEIIADIKFYYVDLTSDVQSAFVGKQPLSESIPRNMFKQHGRSKYKTKESRLEVLTDLYNPGTPYRIGKIVKVKNYEDRIPDDYYWLIYVLDQEGDAVMRMSMLASGLGWDGSAIDKKRFSNGSKKDKDFLKRQLHIISGKEVKESFAEALGEIVADSKIVKLERIGFSGSLGDFTEPAWMIKLQGGADYYYKESTGTVFKVAKTISWKKVNGLRRHPKRDSKYFYNYVPDRLNDKFILLDPVPIKTK